MASVTRRTLRRTWAPILRSLRRSVPQVALNWLLRQPTVSSVIIGARNEEQLRQNLGAVGWSLSDEQARRLTESAATEAAYPAFSYRRLDGFAQLFPAMV